MTHHHPVWKQATWSGGLAVLCAATSLFGVNAALTGEPAAEKTPAQDNQSAAPDDQHRVPLAVARDRAKLLHSVYAATLDMMHHRYFHGDRAVVPARAMKDVFSEMRQESGIEAQWIAVNLKAMSIEHEPKTNFEKKAARELGKGNNQIDTVDEGFYRRAGAIPLTGGCVSCHGGLFRAPDKTPRFAGLIISIPVEEK